MYRAHGAQVRGICGAILRDRHDAEDAAQQVFVSAFNALLGGTAPRDPGAWLATIARHESWARARRRQTATLDPESQDAAQEDPATLVARRGELAGIWRAIERLPESQREALLLREVCGLSYDELVADLDLSHPSVRSLLNRARHTLRAQLRRGSAALGGAPWLNLIARLFGDGPSPALSTASRTAAVGLGALVFTTGAVLVPGSDRMPHPRVTHAAGHVASAPRPVSSVDAAAATPVTIRPAVVAARTPSVRVRDDRDTGRGRSSAHEDSTTVESRSGDSTRSGSDSHGGPGPSAVATPIAPTLVIDGAGGGPGPSSPTEGPSGSDGGPNVGGSSGSSGDSGNSGSSGSGSSGSGSDGGSTSNGGGSSGPGGDH